MSVRPENHFTCNRCAAEVWQAMANSPVHSRAAGPSDWLLLQVGGDPSTPPSHLCAGCAQMFQQFMGRGAAVAPPG
jgi:hypothetical protein